jgi:hypothetical protein
MISDTSPNEVESFQNGLHTDRLATWRVLCWAVYFFASRIAFEDSLDGILSVWVGCAKNFKKNVKIYTE